MFLYYKKCSYINIRNKKIIFLKKCSYIEPCCKPSHWHRTQTCAVLLSRSNSQPQPRVKTILVKQPKHFSKPGDAFLFINGKRLKYKGHCIENGLLASIVSLTKFSKNFLLAANTCIVYSVTLLRYFFSFERDSVW